MEEQGNASVEELQSVIDVALEVGVTKKQIADYAGCTDRFINYMLNGERPITVDSMSAIKRAASTLVKGKKEAIDAAEHF